MLTLLPASTICRTVANLAAVEALHVLVALALALALPASVLHHGAQDLRLLKAVRLVAGDVLRHLRALGLLKI